MCYREDSSRDAFILPAEDGHHEYNRLALVVYYDFRGSRFRATRSIIDFWYTARRGGSSAVRSA